MLGSLLNLVCALGFARLSRATATEPRISSMLAVASTISIGWGLAQLLPLVPFCVGRLLARRLVPKDRLIYATASTALVVAGGFMTVTATQQPSLLVVVLVSGMFAFASLQRAAQQLADEGSGMLGLIARAEAAIQRGECVDAIRLARAGMSTARSAAYRSQLCVAMGWGAIGEGDPFLAHAALEQLPAEALNVHLVAAYLRVCGRLTEAEALLLRARSLGHRTRETTKLLIDVQLLLGRTSEAAELAREDEGLLLDPDLAALRAAGFFTKAAVS
jgi:hypothetical protein